MNKDIKLQTHDVVYYKTENGNSQAVVAFVSCGKSIKEYERDNNCIVTKLDRPQTIYEVKEVLDEKEKEYLSAVIKPFKKRVIRIGKIKTLYGNSEFINIVLYSSISYNKEESIQLPYFKKGKMYKGMKLDKEYTLKELGLE